MLAAVCYKAGKIRIENRDTPVPGAGDVLIKIAYCGICPSDYRIYQGLSSVKLPIVPGHEFSGWIESVGDEVENITIGSRVVVDPAQKCYTQCPACRHGYYNKCIKMADAYNGFAQYHVTRAANVYNLKEKTDLVAASLTEPLACVLRGMEKARVKAGDVVVVVGAGPIGLLHLQSAKFIGAKVIVADYSAERLDCAVELGADMVVNPHIASLEDVVFEVSDSWGANAVIVAASSTSAVEQSVNLLGVGGTLVIFAGIRNDSMIVLDSKRIHYDEINITGSSDYSDADFIKALHFIEMGFLDIKKIISDTVTLEDIEKGMKLVSSGSRLKVVVNIGDV